MSINGYEPFPIAPIRTLIDLGLDPWLTPQDAFQNVENAYTYKGVIYQRDGYTFFDRMPYALSANSNPYQSVSNVTTGVPVTVTTVNNHGLVTGQLIRLVNVGTLTPNAGGVSINGTIWTITVTGLNTFTLNNIVGYSGSYSSGTGTVCYFPNDPLVNAPEPITLITNYIQQQTGVAGIPQLIVCDTKRGAYYDGSQMCLVPIGNADQFTGGPTNLFWPENYFGYLFITNNVDNIFYWNNTSGQQSGGFSTLVPQLGPGFSGTQVRNCLMIRAVNNRLVLFNVNEGGTQFANKVDWCAQGINPTQGSGTNPWDQSATNVGLGGSLTATDSLYLISMAQVQYNLMVWSRGLNAGVLYQFRTTSDPQRPFSFVKVSDTRNVDSTFGTVALDRQIVAVGSTGLVTSDGNSVGRYDDKIPDFAFGDSSNPQSWGIDQDNVNRCYAQRYDPLYQTWTLFTNSGQSQNTNVLVFNYQDLSWQIYDISMSVLGLAQNPEQDARWEDFTGPPSLYPDNAWQDFTDETWSSFNFQQAAYLLLGGDYTGNIWQMTGGDNDAENSQPYRGADVVGNPIPVDILSRQWAPYIQEGKAAQLGYFDVLIPSSPNMTYNVNFYVDDNPTPYLTKTFNAIPNESDFVVNISGITNANPGVVTTSGGHGLYTGQQIWIYGVSGMQAVNNNGFTITVLSPTTFSIGIDTTSYGSYTGGGSIYTTAIYETLFWRRVYCGQQGTFHTVEITTNQLSGYAEIHGMIMWMKKTGRIFR